MTGSPSPRAIVDFWRESGPSKWFAKDDAFDEAIRLRFEETHHCAARGEFASWEESAEGALALLLLLDQFPRNLYRGSAHSFATDGLALRIAAKAVDDRFDQQTEQSLRGFVYLPFEHSESPADQQRSVELFEALGDDEMLKYAIIHRDIIDRFGRFPHRNATLGRNTTPEEQRFLDEGGFSG